MRLRKITGTRESVISSDVVLTTLTTLSMGDIMGVAGTK